MQSTHLEPAQLAERWHSSVAHLANLRSAGAGPEYLKIGRKVLYRLGDVESYEERSLVSTLTGGPS